MVHVLKSISEKDGYKVVNYKQQNVGHRVGIRTGLAYEAGKEDSSFTSLH